MALRVVSTGSVYSRLGQESFTVNVKCVYRDNVITAPDDGWHGPTDCGSCNRNCGVSSLMRMMATEASEIGGGPFNPGMVN